MRFGPAPAEIAARLKQAPWPVTEHSYLVDGQTMHYLRGGNPGKPAVIFVHGSPGSWDAWEKYLTDSTLCDQIEVFAVDRLGYGGSTPGVPVASIEAHAAALRPLVDSLQAQGPVFLVGHSVGGAVVARAAMDYPCLIKGVLILAGTADPTLKKPWAIQHLVKYGATRWLVPPDLDISNREMLTHRNHLGLMAPLWDGIALPLTLMHGKKDAIVTFPHAEYVMAQMKVHPPKLVVFPDENHFIPWTQFPAVREELMAIIRAAGY